MTHRKSTRVEVHTVEGCPSLKLSERWTIQGRSKASDRSGFALLEAGIFFDAGLSTYLAPKALLLTHTHTDHSFALPMIATGQANPFPVLAPRDSIGALRNFLWATYRLSDSSVGEDDGHWPLGGVQSLVGVTEAQPSTKLHTSLHVRAFDLHHRVPAVGYLVYEVRSRLLEAYVGLPNKEIAQLRKEGKAVTHEVEFPVVAYLCDTTIDPLRALFNQTRPPLAPVVLVECTYVNHIHDTQHGDAGSAHRSALERKHVEWDQLRPIAQARSDIYFALIHFSMRYKEAELKEYFGNTATELPNLLLWLDEGVWHPATQSFIQDLRSLATPATPSSNAS